MRYLLLVLALVAGSIYPLSATTISPYSNLGEAALYCESVVLAKFLDDFETNQNGMVFRDAHLKVMDWVKGPLEVNSKFTLRPWSHSTDDWAIDVAGDFLPDTGKTYLLFIGKNGDNWQLPMLSYYVFEQQRILNQEFLVPVYFEGDGIEVTDRNQAEPLGVYYSDALLAMLKAYVSTPNLRWNGDAARSQLSAFDFQAQDRAVPTGCDFKLGNSSALARWLNPAVPIYYDDTSVPANWTSQFVNILSALNSNYTGIDPSNAGSASYTPNCVGGSAAGGNFTSFVNSNLNGAQSALIVFNDPCNQIPDLNNCSGTLALGGSYSSSTTHTFDGQSWQNASYGYVIVNNGVPECFPGVEFERMLTHELTHAYRMDHLDPTTYPNQNMNPSCCKAINTKDRECMNYAYPSSAPVELTSFVVRALEDHSVSLAWETQTEHDNDYFTIERSPDARVFTTIAQVKSKGEGTANQYEFIDHQPFAADNYYRLSQTDFDGSVQILGLKAVHLAGSTAIINIAPNPVSGDVLAFDIVWDNEFDGTLDVTDPSGKTLISTSVYLAKGSQRVERFLGSAPPGVYALRLQAAQQVWTARFVKN